MEQFAIALRSRRNVEVVNGPDRSVLVRALNVFNQLQERFDVGRSVQHIAVVVENDPGIVAATLQGPRVLAYPAF